MQTPLDPNRPAGNSGTSRLLVSASTAQIVRSAKHAPWKGLRAGKFSTEMARHQTPLTINGRPCTGLAGERASPDKSPWTRDSVIGCRGLGSARSSGNVSTSIEVPSPMGSCKSAIKHAAMPCSRRVPALSYQLGYCKWTAIDFTAAISWLFPARPCSSRRNRCGPGH